MAQAIYYLAFYCDRESLNNREYPKSAQTKIDYIISALNRCGVKTTVLSASGAIENIHRPAEKKILSSMASVEYCSSIGKTKGVLRAFDIVMVLIQLLLKLLSLKMNDTLVIYHSPRFMSIVRVAKLLKKFSLIIEAEEIYGEIFDNASLSKRELKFFSLADAFIFSTNNLNSLVNRFHRPSVVVHGAYTDNASITNAHRNNDAIHLVYSGTFAQGKGASRAIDAMMHLPKHYILHIAGYGTDEEESQICKQIQALSPDVRERIVFEGMLLGKEFDDLLNRCEIGLCTQDANASYTLSSFPSKVITYLNHALSVVAIRIPTLINSDVSDIVHFYDEDSPESVAKAVLSIGKPDRTKIEGKLAVLDDLFVNQLCQIVLRGN